jgi:superfamily II DNA or RNA helicase
MITIILGNVSCKVVGNLDEHVRKEFDSKMSYKLAGYEFMMYKSNNFGGWDGRFRLFQKNKSFPIGLLSLAESILKKNSVSYKIKDNRESVSYGSELELVSDTFVPRGYQLDILNKAYEHTSGIVRSATGSGKTSVIAMLCAKYNTSTIVYVIGIELLYQMKDTIEELYGIECGLVGGGHCDPTKKITIMTIWSAMSAFDKKCKIIDNDSTQDTASKNKELNKKLVRDKVRGANLIIIDECQYAASETVQFLHKESKSARHRFLFSGTPWRDSGDDILIESVGGPKFYDLNATKLIKEEYLVPPEIHFINVPSMRGVGSKYHDVYRNYIVENEKRNDLICNAARKLVASGKKVLILVVRISHGNILLDSLGDEFSVDFLDGKKSGSDRMDAISAMKSGDLDILIASKIFDQGVDIPELDALILAGSGKSSGRALQRIGRVIRTNPGKSRAIVVEFFDNCKYLRDHSLKRIEIYRSEPGFLIKLPDNIPNKYFN